MRSMFPKSFSVFTANADPRFNEEHQLAIIRLILTIIREFEIIGM